MTIVLGGLVGQMISCDVQKRLRERDFDDTWLKARGELALAARKEFQQARRQGFDEVVTAAATMANASEELLYITSPQFSTENLKGKNRDLMLAEREKLRLAYREAESTWAPSRIRYDFALAYFAEGDQKVLATWHASQSAVDDYRVCAAKVYNVWYLAGQGRAVFKYSDRLCGHQQRAVAMATQQLGTAFAVKAESAWKGWDNPAELKSELGLR